MNVYQDHDNYNFRRYLTGFYYIIILLSCEHFILHDCMGQIQLFGKLEEHLYNFLLRKYLCPFVNRTKMAEHEILLVRFDQSQRHFHITYQQCSSLTFTYLLRSFFKDLHQCIYYSFMLFELYMDVMSQCAKKEEEKTCRHWKTTFKVKKLGQRLVFRLMLI